MTEPPVMDPSERMEASAPEPVPPVAWAAPAEPPSAASILVYGDVPNRTIAYIIDLIVIFIISFAVDLVLGFAGIAVVSGTGTNTTTNWFGTLTVTAVSLVISGAYFIYSWAKQRATIGMKILGLQIGDAPNGVTITTDQAIKRWLALVAYLSILQAFSRIEYLGLFFSLAGIVWVLFLLYTTWRSPTKQGWHDGFANTMIAKATRAVA